MLKNKYIFFPFILIIIILVTFIIYNSIDNNFKQQTTTKTTAIEKSKLTEYLKPYQNSKKSINILRVKDKIIYGTIETNEYDQFLFTTLGVFMYDIEKDEFNFKKFDNNKRIINLIVINNNLYYSTLSYSENDTFNWELYVDMLNANTPVLLETGKIKNLFDYPRMSYIDNTSAIILQKTNDGTKIKYKIFKISNNITELISGEGDTIENEGVLLYNDDNISIMNNKIYYTIVNADDSQSLIAYDLEKMTQSIIYTNKNGNMAISSFTLANSYILIQLTDKTNEQKSINIILNKNNEQIYSFESEFLTFSNLISYDSILFHNSDNSWKIFQLKNGEYNFQELQSSINNIDNILPKYFILDKNKILIQTFTDQLYYVDISV